MAGRMEGKVAVITGGASGIGRATVLRFLAEGASVVAADINQTTGADMLGEATRAGFGERVRFAATDVTSEPDIEAAIAQAVKEFGRLDCVFNNAGCAGAFGPITHLDAGEWDWTFAVLVRAVMLGMKHGTRAMKKQGRGGCFINTASIAGLAGGDAPQAYSAAKAAVINLTRSVAVELAPQRIRVNAICPGGINTPLIHRGSPEAAAEMMAKMQPWPEAGRPEDIAAVALFLASDEARFVTGEALVADGGLTAAGGDSMRKIGPGDMLYANAGIDPGTTGQEMVLRPVQD
jgi:NAD(P)-dependent dehydrogenase (short-subunit alcohol dehydrogenase family)